VASGQGKTFVTAALARLHARSGRRVRVFKTGPDFLDPMVLAKATGMPVYNIDGWMVGIEASRALLFEAAREADLILVEGAMGLFDGELSTADLAAALGVPVVAVIDAGAMAQTPNITELRFAVGAGDRVVGTVGAISRAPPRPSRAWAAARWSISSVSSRSSPI
jgi:cobyrinic acid a,c-diamide synthase